ncbi:aromatic compound dioxygenase [Coprinopsis marcescibilis]|uniref:Aromatic compound dioxygenase n=1 Tax=Coprinopsis marcescibilis TaxID=230819 RepID=A0A5C3KJ62_COPMA|nr:aromatic compound dioxygenase [Coprinopsis marcescibilis]
MRIFALAPLLALATFVFAHPETEDHPATAEELIARNTDIEARNVAARKCAPQVAEFEAQRLQKRAKLMKRQQTGTFTAPIPRTTSITNNSCVLHPETIEGPYYIRNEFIRSDVRETQPGVALVLDVGVIDSRTCRPYPNAFVEIWAANATGAYGGYVGPQGTPTRIKDDTWLRGGLFTNAQGIVELTTIYPGYYTGRTTHIHAMVHGGNWQSRANGTFVSGSGTVNHIGQFFFDEAWNDRVFATHPYTTNRVPRTYNNRDFIMQQAGPGAVAKLSYLNGNSVTEGVFGYITVVVNGGSNYRIQNNNALR